MILVIDLYSAEGGCVRDVITRPASAQTIWETMRKANAQTNRGEPAPGHTFRTNQGVLFSLVKCG